MPFISARTSPTSASSTLLALTLCALITLASAQSNAERRDRRFCRWPQQPAGTLKAAFSFGMNGRFASPSSNFNYGLSQLTSRFNMTTTQANALAADALTSIQTATGFTFSAADAEGARTSTNGLLNFQLLVTSGPYNAYSVRDETGYFCEEDPDEPAGVVLAEGTASVNFAEYVRQCTPPGSTTGCSYTGTFTGPLLPGDAWAFGIYRLRQGQRTREWKMKSMSPGRAVGAPNDAYLLLNENFRICSQEFGSGTQTLQVLLGFVPGADGFPVSLLNNARFEEVPGVFGQPPWTDCSNPLA